MAKFIRFIIVGTFNTLITLLLIYSAMHHYGLSVVQANVIGYAIGLSFSFILNRSWVFGSRDRGISASIRFFLVIGIAYILNLSSVLLLSENTQIGVDLSQLMGALIYTATCYLGFAFFAFPKQEKDRDVCLHSKPSLPLKTSWGEPRLTLGIIVPCYNESDCLHETVSRLSTLVVGLIQRGILSDQSKIHLIDDGSNDDTWSQITHFAEVSPYVSGIKLSKNHGHQNALLAGLLKAKGDALISIDADLQDDIDAIELMIDAFLQGHQIVYGVRRDRSTDSLFKRSTARIYYKALQLLGVDIVFDHADYRLLGRSALEALRSYREVNLFLRAIIPTLGFKTALVHYDRAPRYAGESKYNFTKMLALAWQGITSFSVIPLRLITVTGILLSLSSFGFSLWVLWVKLYTDAAIPGWASTVLPISFFSGIQLFCMGIIAEYIGKIFLEVKQRPRYIIEEVR